jgi:2-keto-3-deoxy-L-rhamnonate aldolase RhmA
LKMGISIGTFVKTAAPEVVEVLGLAGFDFLAIDAEHAPFGRRELDLMLLAGRAADVPVFVRLPDDRSATILQALDVGAAGLIIPHVDSARQAAAVVRCARFENGERGFSNSARFGNYGTTSIVQAVEIGDRAKVLCQIESAEAVAAADDIAATAGVSGLIVGRADLALSMGLRALDAGPVQHGTESVLAAARKHGKFAGIVVGDIGEIPAWRNAGADLFIILHDQGILRKAATALTSSARNLIAELVT